MNVANLWNFWRAPNSIGNKFRGFSLASLAVARWLSPVLTGPRVEQLTQADELLQRRNITQSFFVPRNMSANIDSNDSLHFGPRHRATRRRKTRRTHCEEEMLKPWPMEDEFHLVCRLLHMRTIMLDDPISNYFCGSYIQALDSSWTSSSGEKSSLSTWKEEEERRKK